MVKKMIQLMRENYRADFVFRLNRLGKKILITYQPDHDAELRQALLLEFFPDYASINQ
jgi:hypothetical protein